MLAFKLKFLILLGTSFKNRTYTETHCYVAIRGLKSGKVFMKQIFFIFWILFMGFQLHATDLDPMASEELIVILETNEGNIELRLFPNLAPKAVENFILLSEKGYYDGTVFHRIIPNFMIQGGDPTGKGTGGQSIWEKPFPNEVDPKIKFNRPGLVGMANSGRNDNGSQFFITTVETPWLNGKHTIFGEVTNGMDIVRKIERNGSPSGHPKKEQVILKAYLKKPTKENK